MEKNQNREKAINLKSNLIHKISNNFQFYNTNIIFFPAQCSLRQFDFISCRCLLYFYSCYHFFYNLHPYIFIYLLLLLFRNSYVQLTAENISLMCVVFKINRICLCCSTIKRCESSIFGQIKNM